MKHKLLNFTKNLIIALGLVVIVVMLFFTTRSYAAESLGVTMRQNISDWYRAILYVSILVYVLGYFVIVLKLLSDRTPGKMKTLKESVLRFIVMFGVIYFLTYIMIAVLYLNSEGIKTAQTIGQEISGINMTDDEYNLYEVALTKAYEIEAVPGFLGLLMYLLLVFYTYKFAFVYIKRYINIIILILLAPIIFVVTTLKNIVTGINDGRITRWFKEFIYNVILQTIHAIAYSMLIGIALKLGGKDDSVFWYLLALVFLGFVFYIDSIIRKIFNFVGGSTKINTSKMAGAAINMAGGALNAGLGAVAGGANAIGNGATKFGENIDQYGLKDGISQSFSDAGDAISNKASDMANSVKQLPSNIKQKAIDFGNDAKDKVVSKYEDLKDEYGSREKLKEKLSSGYQDAKEVMSGKRVKDKLTNEEIVAEAHAMAEAKGIEGLRKSVQHAGAVVIGGAGVISKKTKKAVEKGYGFAKGKTKDALNAAVEELNKDIRTLQLENEVELIKKLPKIIRNQQIIKLRGKKVKLDTTSAMMFMVDINFDSKKLIEDIKKEYQTGNPVMYKAFEKLGAQMLLSPVVGSARLGMSVLAEDKYEEIAEHRIEEAVTGRVRSRKTVKRPRIKMSDLKLETTVNVSLQRERAEVNSGIKEQKRYTFNRFNQVSAKKITNRMLRQSRENNKYIATITKTHSEVQTETLKVRGSINGGTPIEINHTIKASRKDAVKSVRKMKMAQEQAISSYRQVEKQTRRVEMANNVAGQMMTARNVVRLGFMQIDQMSSGEIGLRKMIQEGRVQELSSGLVAISQDANVANKIVATGLVKQGEENTVVQFVVTEEGKIIPQIVTTEGQVLNAIVTEDGQIVPVSVATNVEQQVAAPTIAMNTVITMTPEEQAAFTNIMNQAVEQFKQEIEAGERAAVQLLENETEEQAIIRTLITETIAEYAQEGKAITAGEVPVVERRENETEEEFMIRKMIVETFASQYVKPEAVSTIIPMDIPTIERTVQNEQFENAMAQVFNNIVAENPAIIEELNVVPLEGETEEQAVFRTFMNQAVEQYRQEVEAGERPAVQVLENETEEQAIIRTLITETITEYAQEGKTITVGEAPVLQIKENETPEQFALRQVIVQTFTEHAQKEVPVALEEIKPAEQAQVIENIAQVFSQYVKPEVVPNVISMDTPTIERVIQNDQFENAMAQVFNNVVAENPAIMEQLTVVQLEGETKEQAVLRTFMSQAVEQYKQEVEAGERPAVQLLENETEEQAIVRALITETIVEYAQEGKTVIAGEVPVVERRDNETDEEFAMRKMIVETFTSQYERLEAVPTVIPMDIPTIEKTIESTIQTEQFETNVAESIGQYLAANPEVVEQLNVVPMEGETIEQAAIREFVAQTITEFTQDTKTITVGETPILQPRENETPEEFAVRQAIIEVFTGQYEATIDNTIIQPAQILENVKPEEQIVIIQSVADAFKPFIQSIETPDMQISISIEEIKPEAQDRIIEQIAEIFHQPAATLEALKPEEKTQFVENIVETFREYIKPEQPQVSPQELQKPEEQEKIVQEIMKAVLQITEQPVEQPVDLPEATTYEEKVERADKIVQHIVNLQGDVIEQVVDTESGVIETTSYKVVEKGKTDLVDQIQDVITNADLGLALDATVEERMTTFEGLLDDVQRSASTETLLEQVITQTPTEERELDEILVGAMQDSGIANVAELRQVFSFDDGALEPGVPQIPGVPEDTKEELQRKREMFEKLATDKMVSTSTPSSTSGEVDTDDILGDALSTLNDRVSRMSSDDNDRLFDIAAEMERARVAEELVGTGEFTVSNPPTDSDIDAKLDAKVDNLSDLLLGLAKEHMGGAAKYTVEVVEETVNGLSEVIKNEVSEMKPSAEAKAEKEYQKELEKAEKKWAKDHKTKADNSVIEEHETQTTKKSKKGEDSAENQTIKITLRFYGHVKNQGQSVTLSNRYSIKDFYDKVEKLEDASLEKTQEQFLKDHGGQLKQMQLTSFSFAKNPVEDMDGWSIYVVGTREDVDSEERTEKQEPVDPALSVLISKYSLGLRSLFRKFVEEYEITSFDDIHTDQSIRGELIRRVRMFLFRRDEKNEHDKATKIVDSLHKIVEFKNLLREINRDRIAKSDGTEAAKKAKSKVKITNKKTAESQAARSITDEEVEEYKETEKTNLMDQILGTVNISPQDASFEVQELLSKMNESLYEDLGIKNTNKTNGFTLQYQTSDEEEEMMP